MIKNALEASQSDWQLQILSRALGGLNNKYIVDVGCGVGRFLVMAKAQGADVVGCDLSPEACEFAQNHLGIVVHCKTLQECAPSVGRVDAVIMRDLIEHPLEPMATVEAAYEMLKPGGCLLIHTPNGGGGGDRSCDSALEWVGFRVDLEHLQYLSPQTINWLSQKHNMRIERLEAFGFPGLKGIEKLPSFANKSSKAVHLIKQVAGKIPGMRETAKILRTIKNEITGDKPRDSRLGSSHLFAILRRT
jgi:2-polyprenyl-3-methyl-5-hydroxy-6-metoxy-1,4-benzoquinol methylase